MAAARLAETRVPAGVSRQQAQEWCIRHSFELVELSPQEVPEDGECPGLGALSPGRAGWEPREQGQPWPGVLVRKMKKDLGWECQAWRDEDLARMPTTGCRLSALQKGRGAGEKKQVTLVSLFLKTRFILLDRDRETLREMERERHVLHRS